MKMESAEEEFLLDIFGKLDPFVTSKNKKNINCENYYQYKKVFYEKVKNFENFTKLVNCAKTCKGFILKQFEQEDQIYLGLFFIPELYNQSQDVRSPVKLSFLLENFFTIVEPSCKDPTYQQYSAPSSVENGDSEPVETNFEVSLEHFYDELKQAYDLNKLDSSVIVQHPKLRPVLRPYQANGIKWMLNRETNAEYIPTEFTKITSKNFTSQEFYYNARTAEIYSHNPGDFLQIPMGGILADEMGLGKTVEILGLILCNPRRMKRKLSDVEKEMEEPAEDVNNSDYNPENYRLHCLCTSKSKTKVVLCGICETLQHENCVMKNSTNKKKNYKCPNCWKGCNEIVETGTTIICSPASIKMQWQDEINKHIRDTSFKVLIYNGVSGSGWISPDDFAAYDVVITDFNVLKSEIYYTKPMERNMRKEKQFIKPISPLSFVNFWRVCLDEAQMVENPSNQCSKMVKLLNAHHRWAVTGTPFENHISNLGGLLDFLDFIPYSDIKIWGKLCHDYILGVNKNLIEVLSKIFWRTCKRNVIHELGIPPQTEIVHTIKMTDLHTFFYNQVHIDTEIEFKKNARRICDDQEIMFHMNHNTIRKLLEPLRKLRQDCTIPSIFHRSAETSVVKQTLTPNELQDHLISNNEIDCKAELRTIASSLNGMAALHVAKGEFNEAIQHYKSVIKLANDYTGTIHVDALLKIHALHNLAEISVHDEDELKQRDNYIQESNRLEWKYINSYYEKVRQVQTTLQERTQTLLEVRSNLNDIDGNWWREVLYSFDSNIKENVFFERIRADLIKLSGLAIQEEIRSIRGVDYSLTVWWNKVQSHHKMVLKKFQDLEYFSKNLNPEMSQNEKARVNELIMSAFECHLNLEKKDDDESEDTMEAFCELCVLKQDLSNYEVLIFDKILSEKNTQGSWNPRVEENILKIIFNFAKRDKFDNQLIKTAETFLKYLEALKNQFKDLGQLWVEVNYSVSGWDEINMCKTRLEVVDDKPENDSKFSSKISKFEIDDTYATFQLQKADAEKEFIRFNGRIKYLKYLKEKNEPQQCPICEQIPNDRYCVLECAHNLCLMCFTQLLKFNKSSKMICPLCRATQNIRDVYTVTCSQDSDSIRIKGSYSSKIDEIVKHVLKLRAKESDVKIIIFSQWDNILNVIGNALEANSITFASNKGNFAKVINSWKDYKQNITCLLMNLKQGSKGLNLTEATHCFLVEPIIDPAEELQAISRIHRIGQTRPTFVHRFIVAQTIEETIFNEIMRNYSKWKSRDITVKNLENLFLVNGEKLNFNGFRNF